MKLEIEITDEEIKSAIERKVRVAIADQSNQWSADNHIKSSIKNHWNDIVDKLVMDAISDSENLREKIVYELERKLRTQLAAALKAVKE